MKSYVFFFAAEDGIRDGTVTGVQTCALPISEGEAFCPGHVTVFFEVHDDPDPRKKGSRGAGLCLDLGVHTVARVRDEARSSIDVIVNGRRQKAEVTQRVAQRVLGDRSCEVKILSETN